MSAAENIERLVKKFYITKKSSVTTSAKMDKRVLDDALAAYEKSETIKSADLQPIVWRIIMKSRITKLATAAVIIIAVMVGINHFGGSIDGASVAFADVLEEIYKARSVAYKQTILRGANSYTVEKMVIEPSHVRSDAGGNVSITDFNQGINLQLFTEQKKAVMRQDIGRPLEERLLNRIEWISKLHEKLGEFTGHEEIDGEIAEVFLIQENFETTTVWVNPETNLPIRVEKVSIPNPEKNIIVPRMCLSEWDFIEADARTEETVVTTVAIKCKDKYRGIQNKTTLIMSDFSWNADLDQSLFSIVPPKDCEVLKLQSDASDEDEKDLIYSLGFWAEMSNGAFPSTINDIGDPNKVKPMLMGKFDGDGNPKEEFKQALQAMEKILNGLMFAQQQRIDGSWHYAGDGVQLGDTDTAICWWKYEDLDIYRVVYGDLNMGDSNKLPD